MGLPIPFDWKSPDYDAVFRWRAENLRWLEANPQELEAVKDFYRDNPAQWITDWGVTSDPRNIEIGLPALMPFVLFPRQVEWVDFVMRKWRERRPGLTDKSRDCGVSWLAVGLSCHLCLFYPGMAIGFGSRKEEYVDKIGAPKSIFHKIRMFMDHLPQIFQGGWEREKHAPFMRIIFPETDSFITGESGDSIGRGDRTAMYFVDEAAHLEHPELAEASLSATTNCRQDVSSVNGPNNPFAQKMANGKIERFSFDWREDPRKDEAWYLKQCDELDERTIAQEIDRNVNASVDGILIPTQWIQSAIGACAKLGIERTGARSASLDVADEGVDENCASARHGIELFGLKSWSGKGIDILKTTIKAFGLCEDWGVPILYYDSDGLGAGVRGDARDINETRRHEGKHQINIDAFRGSGAVHDPEGKMCPPRLNKDYFENFKSQSWWALRLRFEKTHRTITGEKAYPHSDLISLDPALPELNKLVAELSQPQWELNKAGKIVIIKTPTGMKSPNRADSVMIVYNPGARKMETWAALGRSP